MRRIVLLLTPIFVAASCALPAYAYIDPGTGSMLFSIVLGAITTLIFVFNTLILKIKMKFCVKTNSKNLKNEKIVIYSEGKQYYCVFKPILDEFEKRKIPVTFFTSDKEDSFFEDKYEYVKGECIGKGNSAYFKLAMLKCDICLMTTPQLDVLQLKRSKYVKHYSHIFHSITFSMGYKLFSLDYYDSVLCDAEFQIDLIREIEKKRNLPAKELKVVGSTYMDYYFSQLKNINAEKTNSYTILIAPTWGKNGLFSKYGDKIIEQLKDKNFNIIIRPHPQSMIVEKKLITHIMDKYKNYHNISWNFDSNNLEVLSKSDILISDFSSVMFDYAFLFNRPFLFFNTLDNNEIYDISDLDDAPFRYHVMHEIGKEVKEEEINQISDIIENFKNNDNIVKKIEEIKKISWEYQGFAAKNTVDFLIEKQKEINLK